MTILIDCDGVLTDGKQYIDHTGEKMFLAFHSRDVRAIRELIANGYHVVIVTANDSESVKKFAGKVGADYHYSRDKGNLPYENYIAVGDDAWDLRMLEKAQLAFCPKDADPALKYSNMGKLKMLPVNGGQGVIAELVRHIL